MQIPDSILNRKGAHKTADVPSQVLELLNQGKIETVNLTEWLVVDHSQLLQQTFPNMGLDPYIPKAIKALQTIKNPTAKKMIETIGASLFALGSADKRLDDLFEQLSTHKSDSVRCYAPYLIAPNKQQSIQDKLQQVKTLAADTHFGVREVAWLALRPCIIEDLEASIECLSTWSYDADENIRRFASEATRPRGVWCKHIEQLKINPELGLPILDPLKSDPAEYVQLSVGNWLNDASKSNPSFVKNICKEWQAISPTKITEKITKRALRSLAKQA